MNQVKRSVNGAEVRPSVKPGKFRLGFLVHDVSRLRRTVVDKALKPLGVTRSQWWVLANLSRDGNAMMQTELAHVLDIGKVALGGLLDRLEANGYVARRADPEDRRAKRVELTPAGATLLAAIQERAALINGEMMVGVDEAEILLAEDILHRLKQRLIAMDGQMRQPPEAEHAEETDALPTRDT